MGLRAVGNTATDYSVGTPVAGRGGAFGLMCAGALLSRVVVYAGAAKGVTDRRGSGGDPLLGGRV